MGDVHAVVERVEPPREFAFRWMHDAGVPVGAEAVSTLVEFTLAPAGDGTRLRLVESGFADETHQGEQRGLGRRARRPGRRWWPSDARWG